MELIETRNGAHDPARIDGFGEGFQIFCERNIAQDRVFHRGGKLEKIGEQAIKDANLVFERGFAVLGERRGVSEKLPEALAARRALEDAQRIAATLFGFLDVHFDGQTGAAFGELRGELQFCRFALGFCLENVFDFGLRKRREVELQTAGDDCGEQRKRRRRGQDERSRTGRFFEDFQKNVGDVPAHGLRAIQNEYAAAAHRLEIGGALNSAKLADTQHGAGDRAF